MFAFDKLIQEAMLDLTFCTDLETERLVTNSIKKSDSRVSSGDRVIIHIHSQIPKTLNRSEFQIMLKNTNVLHFGNYYVRGHQHSLLSLQQYK